MHAIRRCAIIVAVANLAALLFAVPASAQILPYEQSQVAMDRYTPVRERRIPGYSAEGIGIGAFQLSPSITAATVYDDNVFATKSNAKSDVFERIEPGAVLQTRGEGAYDIALRARARIDRYAKYSTENTESWEVGGTGKLELGSTTGIRAGLLWRNDVESRQASSIFTDTIKPITYQTYGAGFGFRQDFNAIRSSTELSALGLNFANALLRNGARLDQGYRDSRALTALERVSYAQTPSLAFFMQGRFTRLDYRRGAPGRPKRDSSEYEVLAGTTFEGQFPARGEIAIGYLARDLDNSFYRDVGRLSFNVKLEVFPSDLTTITATARRRADDTGDPRGGAARLTEATLTVDHELLRTLVISARADYLHNRADNIDRLDRAISAGVSATYRLNAYLSLTGGYDHMKRTSRGLNGFRPFEANRLSLSLTLRK